MVLLANVLGNQIAGEQSGNFLRNHSEICGRAHFRNVAPKKRRSSSKPSTTVWDLTDPGIEPGTSRPIAVSSTTALPAASTPG